MTYATIIIVSCWIILGINWVIGSFYQKLPSGKPDYLNRFMHKIYLGISFTLLMGYSIYPLFAMVVIRQSLLSDIISIILCVLGLVIATWARIVLAGNWSVSVSLKKKHELEVSGPYRFVRHPIYAGLLSLFIGTCIAIGRLGGFIGFVILVVGLGIKIRQEESLMIGHFGKRYLEYIGSTKILVPFLL